MTKFWTKIKAWFKPKLAHKSRPPKAKNSLKAKPTSTYQPINRKHYRQLIGKITKQAIAIQRARRRRNC